MDKRVILSLWGETLNTLAWQWIRQKSAFAGNTHNKLTENRTDLQAPTRTLKAWSQFLCFLCIGDLQRALLQWIITAKDSHWVLLSGRHSIHETQVLSGDWCYCITLITHGSYKVITQVIQGLKGRWYTKPVTRQLSWGKLAQHRLHTNCHRGLPRSRTLPVLTKLILPPCCCLRHQIGLVISLRDDGQLSQQKKKKTFMVFVKSWQNDTVYSVSSPLCPEPVKPRWVTSRSTVARFHGIDQYDIVLLILKSRNAVETVGPTQCMRKCTALASFPVFMQSQLRLPDQRP